MKRHKYKKLKLNIYMLLRSYMFSTLFSILIGVIIAGNLSIIDFGKLFSLETMLNELIGRNLTTKRQIWKKTKTLFM